jgi:hypothetical protein
MVDKVLAQYQISEKLGECGMDVVSKAPGVGYRTASLRAHTGVMRETDLRDTEALLIQLSHRARPDREASLILERVKLYLADQFNRGDRPYVLPAEFAAAGKTTRRFYPREGDTRPKHQ